MTGTKTRWSYEEWGKTIDAHFERHFWVDNKEQTEATTTDPHPDLINRRGIYKDSFGATQPWTDYQLRPNFVVALSVAPSMFNASNAWIALSMAVDNLLGPLGMKTLDPSDWSYRPDYYNSDDSSDPATSHGFNYHQGPGWLWPVGYLLKAMLHFAPLVGGFALLKRTVRQVKTILARHFIQVQQSPWRSLPELTNADGQTCHDSSPAQAWSMASILEVKL